MTMNKLLGISLAIIMVLGSTPLGFSEPLRVQLEQGIETDQIQCDNPNHVLVQRTNGKLACVSEKVAERTGWEIIDTVKKIEHVESGLVNDSVIKISTKEITPNFITTLSSSQNKQTEQSGEVIGSLFGQNYNYGHAELPVHSMTYPDTVKLNEEFEVIINYSYVIYDEDGEDADEICFGCYQNLHIGLADNVEINDDDYTQTSIYKTPISLGVLPVLTKTTGFIGNMEPSGKTLEEFVTIQQKTIKLTIHERKDIDFRLGGISFIFPSQVNEDSMYLEYMINPDGTILLSHETIIVPDGTILLSHENIKVPEMAASVEGNIISKSYM